MLLYLLFYTISFIDFANKLDVLALSSITFSWKNPKLLRCCTINPDPIKRLKNNWIVYSCQFMIIGGPFFLETDSKRRLILFQNSNVRSLPAPSRRISNRVHLHEVQTTLVMWLNMSNIELLRWSYNSNRGILNFRESFHIATVLHDDISVSKS